MFFVFDDGLDYLDGVGVGGEVVGGVHFLDDFVAALLRAVDDLVELFFVDELRDGDVVDVGVLW